MRVIDAYCFAGGFTCGAVRAGFTLVSKHEGPGGFGLPLAEGNRHILGSNWWSEARCPGNWEPDEAELLIGNPPCSGFSTVTDSKHRGIDAKVNSCMWDFWRYAARCRGVKVAVMESVQQTFIQGRTLMQQLHAELERLTGKKWNLTHVLHSCAQCGGASVRKRYFMVCSTEDIDFQIEEPDVVRVPSVWDTIGDLETCEVTAEEQDINPATMLISRYISRARRRDNRVDGHLISNSACARRASTLAQAVKWKNGENIEMTIGQAMDEDKEVLLRGIGFDTYALARALLYGGDSGGASRFSCFRMNQFDVAPTLTGGALQLFVHPTLPRTLTHREVARIQGFTDDWSCQPAIDAGQKGHLWWGKGVTVQAGEWICKEVAMCLKGRNMGNMAHKEQVGEREFIVDVTGKYLLPTTHGKD